MVGLEGSLQANVGGDASVSLSTLPGTQSSLQAGGDVQVRLPGGSSLQAELQAEGDLRVEGAGQLSRGGDSAALTLGAGEATLKAAAGGDLALFVTARVDSSDWAGAVTAEVEAALADAEAEIDAELGDGSALASEVGEQVRRALDRALRPSAPRAREEAEGGGTQRERQTILAMLADHRITAEQAEALFRALEGEAP